MNKRKTKRYADLIISWSPFTSVNDKPIDAILKSIYTGRCISAYTVVKYTNIFSF